MSAAARIGLLLLGLLALAGAVHAPLHDDGAACSPASLCSGASPLAESGAAASWAPSAAVSAAEPPAALLAPRDLRPRLTVRGRAPPRA